DEYPRQAKSCAHQRGVSADRDESRMGEVDDLHHPEHDQKTGRDDEEQSRRGDDIEGNGQHAGLRREAARSGWWSAASRAPPTYDFGGHCAPGSTLGKL